ncbi:hypothetical protein E4U30_007696 [Claviceps sp. LM220 group G6]|nr:hypothetical protein E4U15_006224 [Claviceps sp. LM218 group G6]KAG6090972.1 hypothetical protein E4U30_007696 [Claviceps sp. LM220 group G6]
MKSIIFLVSLLSLKASALPEPEEAVIFDGKHTYRGGDVKRTRNMGAGPLGSNAHLTSVNASAKTAAGPAAAADIFANPAPSLMYAWNKTSGYLSGGTE